MAELDRGGRGPAICLRLRLAKPSRAKLSRARRLPDQSGVGSNLAVWQLLQSGDHTTAINLIVLPTWRNLELAPIWSIWRLAQSGNLAAEPIWRNTTKSIKIKRPLPSTHDITKMGGGSGNQIGPGLSD